MGNTSGQESTDSTYLPARQVETVSGQETNRFVQSMFEHNEELAFLPLRLLADGERVIHRAEMKKTKAIELPFDIREGSVRIIKDQQKELWGLSFAYDASGPFSLTVNFSASEKRSVDDFNSVIGVETSFPEYRIELAGGKGVFFQQPATIDVNNLLEASFSKKNDDMYSQVYLVFEKKAEASRRDISKLYCYGKLQKIQSNIVEQDLNKEPTKAEMKVIIGKKGVQVGKRFLWTKNIYKTPQSPAESSAEEPLCAVCVSNIPDTLITPCLHFNLCLSCAIELKRRYHKCPLCRNSVEGYVHLNTEERKTYTRQTKEVVKSDITQKDKPCEKLLLGL